MKKRREESIYSAIQSRIKEGGRQNIAADQINIHETVRNFRMERGMSGVELCRRAGDLDPRTLTALEKGRIKNPSIQTLQSVARGLGITVSDLFREAEVGVSRHFHIGTQKGVYQLEFPAWGLKIVSFTPFVKDFFCGKLIFASRKKVDQTVLRHPMPMYVTVLVGKIEIEVEDRKVSLKEGENLFFNGLLRHTFYNPMEKDTVLMLVTSPSFL